MNGPAQYPDTVGGAAKRARRAKPKKTTGSAKKPRNPPTIKDRIRAGAKVHVGKLGGMYIVFDGKKHSIKC